MQRRMAVGLLMTVGYLAGVQVGTANNVAVTNTDLKLPGTGTVKVQFDLSWDNSWRDGVNWDACWVFVKYSTDAGTNWSHATLAASGTNPPSFSTGTNANLEIVVPADKKGAFIERSSAGTGTVASANVQLVWNFATNGVLASQSARVKVFAIEMVYCAEGSFEAGSGGSGVNEFTKTTINTPDAKATGGYPTGQTAPANASWPNGYGAFYLMKTEISQRQYCDFLNTLTATQQGNRHDSGLHFHNDGSWNRNFIKKTSGSPVVFGCDANNNAGTTTAADPAKLNESNDGGWVACNYLSWMDGAAYADWAGLRPMTELEFEKACRGTLSAVADEYAWGNTTLETPTASLSGAGTTTEAPNQGNCNYDACSPDGPYRCGSYADASSSRQNAGAGYYGALDLSGSLWERPVTIGNATGRGFTGGHGDGTLSGNGNANETNWPGLSLGEVTGADGAGFRGGGWSDSAVYARASDRSDAASSGTGRYLNYGWRGARSAP